MIARQEKKRLDKIELQPGPGLKSGAAPLEPVGGQNRQAPPQGVKIENDDQKLARTHGANSGWNED